MAKKQKLVNMIRLKGCPYDLTECCGSDYDDLSIDKHKNEISVTVSKLQKYWY